MKYLWQDSGLLAVTEAHIDPQDRGFLLGDGVFETMRLSGRRILRLDAHLARLATGAALLRLPLPDETLLRQALSRLIEANATDDGSLRLTLTRGVGPRGILPPAAPCPTLLITQNPASTVNTTAPAPCKLHISRWQRDGASPLSRIKHLNYLPQILARIEAEDAGFDDALLLSGDGQHIAEASAASLVLLMDEHLVTPPLSDGALAGIARATLLATGVCVERRVTLPQLCAAGAGWLVNSLSVREIGAIGSCALQPNPVLTARLTDLLAQGAP